MDEPYPTERQTELPLTTASRKLADAATPRKSTLKTSEIIRSRILDSGRPFLANDSIVDFIQPGELEELQAEVEAGMEQVLQALVIDTENDHNTNGTAKRVAKMFIHEVMMGRFYPKPTVTTFPNAKKLDEMIIQGPIKVRSMCSHHMAPIIGEVWIGCIPGDKVIGLSKFNRLAHWIMSRPQIQEEACMQLVDTLIKETGTENIMLVMRANHMCVEWRGVKDESVMGNSIVRGLFKHNPGAKMEFLELIKGHGY